MLGMVDAENPWARLVLDEVVPWSTSTSGRSGPQLEPAHLRLYRLNRAEACVVGTLLLPSLFILFPGLLELPFLAWLWPPFADWGLGPWADLLWLLFIPFSGPTAMVGWALWDLRRREEGSGARFFQALNFDPQHLRGALPNTRPPFFPWLVLWVAGRAWLGWWGSRTPPVVRVLVLALGVEAPLLNMGLRILGVFLMALGLLLLGPWLVWKAWLFIAVPLASNLLAPHSEWDSLWLGIPLGLLAALRFVVAELRVLGGLAPSQADRGILEATLGLPEEGLLEACLHSQGLNVAQPEGLANPAVGPKPPSQPEG